MLLIIGYMEKSKREIGDLNELRCSDGDDELVMVELVDDRERRILNMVPCCNAANGCE